MAVKHSHMIQHRQPVLPEAATANNGSQAFTHDTDCKQQPLTISHFGDISGFHLLQALNLLTRTTACAFSDWPLLTANARLYTLALLPSPVTRPPSNFRRRALSLT
jgi:hypothetical protein